MGQFEGRCEDHCFNCGDDIGGDVTAASENEEVYCSIDCQRANNEHDDVVCDVCGRDWHCTPCGACEFKGDLGYGC